MKGTRPYALVGGDHIKFAGAKKRSANGEEQNTLVALVRAKDKKIKRKSKAKDTSKSEDDNEA